MEDDLLDVTTVVTTGIVCFIIPLVFGFDTIPTFLCGVAASAAQTALIRACIHIRWADLPDRRAASRVDTPRPTLDGK